MAFGGFSFGTPTQPQQQGQQQGALPQVNLQGPTPASTPSGTTFSFGTPQQSQPAATTSSGGGLFGSNTQQQQQPQQQQGGGLFGASNTGAGAGGGLFGAKPATTTTTPAGGLFGGNASTSTSNQPQGTSLFGQPQQQQQQQQQQQGTSLFGQPQQQQQQGTSLFGHQPQSQSQSQPQQGQQNQTSLFGNNQQQPQSQQNTFGQKPQGLQLGQSSSTTTTGGQGGMGKGTKFTDLPEQHQKAIEQLDAAFRQQKRQVYGTLDSQEDLQRAIQQVINDVKSAEQECTALELGLAPLRRACEQLSIKVKSEEEDLQRLADIWASYRPVDGRPSSLRAGALRDFRKQYFRKVVADSEERIPRYKKTIAELRRAVDSLHNTNEISSPQAISQTIQNHQNAIYTLAAQVEGLEVRWNDVRGTYSQMYKDKTGSIRDPLDVARERAGLPPVRT